MKNRIPVALMWIAAAAVMGSGLLAAPAPALAVKKVAPITIVINQPPWCKGLAGLID